MFLVASERILAVDLWFNISRADTGLQLDYPQVPQNAETGGTPFAFSSSGIWFGWQTYLMQVSSRPPRVAEQHTEMNAWGSCVGVEGPLEKRPSGGSQQTV